MSTPHSASGAQRRPRAIARTVTIRAPAPSAKITSRSGWPPATIGRIRSTSRPPPIHRAASAKDGRASSSHWIPTAPSAGTTRYATNRSRPGLCRYTSPKGNASTRERNHAARTTTVRVSRYERPANAPKAQTRYLLAASRSANGMQSRMAAPTYAPGVEASPSGHPAQIPSSAIGRSSSPAPRARVPSSAWYPSPRLEAAIASKRGYQIATFASGRNSRNAADSSTAFRLESDPLRTSRTARASTYARASPVAITSPCDRCEVAT